MALSDGNGWVECRCGSRHWGRFGAAGLLLVHLPVEQAEAAAGHPPRARQTESSRGAAPTRTRKFAGAALPGTSEVLLQHRAAWSHQGSTWGVPGGARDSHEDVVTTALRETLEETGIDAATAALLGVHRADHGTWHYTTVIMTVGQQRVPRGNRESVELLWVPVEEVAARPLHPGFAEAWPVLRGPRARLVVDVMDVAPRWSGSWGREPAVGARRLIDAIGPIVGVARSEDGALITLASPIVGGPGALAASADPAVLVAAAGAGGPAQLISTTTGAGDLVVSGDDELLAEAARRGAATAKPDWLFGVLDAR